MAALDGSNTTTSTMDTSVSNFTVAPKIIDEAGYGKETYWYNTEWPNRLGYYKKIPELKKATDALGMWAFGKGWTTEDPKTKVWLDHIRGWGKDTFDSILQNLLVTKKINGDAYAEIIRTESGVLVNLKVIGPQNIRHVLDEAGLIIGYDLLNGKGEAYKRKQPKDILHICNDRVANEMHGVSVVEVCQWVIDARNEAMSDKRRVHHRSTIRVMEIDADDTTTMNSVRAQYAVAIDKGELLIVPKNNVSFPDAPINYIDTLDWIQYLENFFYQALGVPKMILGGAQDFTEASSKMGYLTFEQPYMVEQRNMEQDLWNQLGVKITFNRPVSLKDELLTDEAANTGQTNVQPNDTTANSGAA